MARVIGLLTSSFPGVQFGPLHYRHIEWDKTESLKSSKGDFDGKMKLSPPSINELNWWISNIQHSYSNISHGKPDLVIYTDASMTGWGGVLNDISCSGFWTPAEASNHINYLELRAVYLVLQSLQSKVTKKHVKLMVDNTTAVSCIMNMGTSHSKLCNHITFEIWEWCIRHSVWLSIAHIPGVANVLADKASRLNTYHTEWMLSRKIFAKSIAKLGVTPQIDLFASRLNYQLEPYISYQPDPGALAVNAFHSDWSQFTFYAFPPFSIIQRTLSKIREDQATGLLIVPKWPTQTWYPQLLKMLVQHPIMLPTGKTTLTLPSQPAAVHPLYRTLRLMICHLSGQLSLVTGFHRSLVNSSCHHGRLELRDNMGPKSGIGSNSVIKEELIQFHHL